MNNKTLYFNLCKEVDNILIKSGIRSRCIKCSNQKTHYETIDGKIEWVGGSCCHRCKHLSKTGCKIQSLSCKLWLCKERKVEWKQKLTSIRKLKRFNEIINIAVDNNLLIFREGFYRVNKNLKNKFPCRKSINYQNGNVYIDGINYFGNGMIERIK
jgi:hypothetical protein